MINLLFITNNPRAELVCGHFQQQLKVRIDLVADFDQGLKAVFEQRPSVVCIQEQIASVTGESVARHIQMLLGAEAPSFVLLHEGNSKLKPVPRLFEHLVDLSAPFEQVSSNLCQALQLLLANYRELLCPTVLPAVSAEKTDLPERNGVDTIFTGGAETSSEAFPEQQQVNDFIDFFESSAIGGPPVEKPVSTVFQPAAPATPATPQPPPAAAVIRQPEQAPVDSHQSPAQPPQQPPKAPAVLPAGVTDEPQSTTAADDVSIPVEALLLAVEENYLRRKRLLWFSLAGSLLLVAAVVVWWFWPRPSSFTGTPVAPPTASSAVTAPKPVVQQPSSSTARPPSPPRQEPFPLFVSSARRDQAFDAAQPGWSRFLTDHREYRLFYEKGSLQAVQVLALGGNGIATSEIRQVVQELTGSDQYQVKQQSRKQGIWVEEAAAHRGNVGLLIYRTAQRGPISAFVIARTP